MKVVVHVDMCIGSGACEMLAPDVFEIGDDMKCRVLIEEPGNELHDDVEMAAGACPTRAIVID